MTIEANKQHLREMAAAISAGDLDKYLDGLADDVRWTIIGTTAFSGVYAGKHDVVNRLFSRLGEVLEGGIEVSYGDMVGEGDVVVAEARGKAKTKSGADYNNTYCLVYRFAGGKVAEITEYLDTELVTKALG